MHALANRLPKQLADWHEGRAAVRMLVAALLAYISTTMLHIPGPYSAVITTLIVDVHTPEACCGQVLSASALRWLGRGSPAWQPSGASFTSRNFCSLLWH